MSKIETKGDGESTVIWRDGDPWRDLTHEAADAGQVTVVSLHGTARLLDFAEGVAQQARVPLEGGHQLHLDSTPVDLLWRPLRIFYSLTPCGFTTWEEAGSPVRLVLAGIHTDWMNSPVGREAVDAVMTRSEPKAPGHPTQPCQAAYCPVRRS